MERFTPPVVMMGGGLKRYHPDRPQHPQQGRRLDRFAAGVMADTVNNFVKGMDINGQPFTKTSFKSGYNRARKGVKRSIATRAVREGFREGVTQVKKKARRSIKDVFGY